MLKKHKILSLVLAAFLMSSVVHTAAFAEEIPSADIAVTTPGVPPVMPPVLPGSTSDESDVAMRAALTKVKERISVPSELSEFTYSSYTNRNTTSYNFNWNTPSSASVSKTLSITIVGDIITNYYYYDGKNNNWSEPRLAKLSDTELLKKAKDALKKANPYIAARSVMTSNGTTLFGSTAGFSFKRMVNGVPADYNNGTIEVDKNTGSLVSMYVTWWDNASFESKNGVLTQDELIKAYKELNTLTPYYRISTDWQTGKKSVYIVYEPSFTNDIDAKTGKESSMYKDRNKLLYGSNDIVAIDEEDLLVDTTAPAEGSAFVKFTPSEIKAINANEKLITKEKVNEILKNDKYIKLNDDFKTTYSNLYEEVDNYTDTSTYYWDLGYEYNKNSHIKNINARINAENGEIISFNSYSYYSSRQDEDKKPKLNVTSAAKTAEEALKYYLPDIADKFKANQNNLKEVETWGEKNEYYETSRIFTFNRFVGGIQVTGDDIRITVDSENQVTGFNYNYSDDVKFPSANSIISVEKAYETAFAEKPAGLKYSGFVDNEGKAHTYLVYNPGSYYVNARTGKLCNYDGTDFIPDGPDSVFSDIEGIAAEKAITELKRHGVSLVTSGGKFEPDKLINSSEFTDFLSLIYRNNGGITPYSAGANDASEVVEDINGNIVYLTKADACKYLVQAWGAEDYAKLKGIYTTPFSDVPSTRSDIGYIALCYGKGAISQTSGKFNPDSSMTRAEAVKMIYDYLVKQQ